MKPAEAMDLGPPPGETPVTMGLLIFEGTVLLRKIEAFIQARREEESEGEADDERALRLSGKDG